MALVFDNGSTKSPTKLVQANGRFFGGKEVASVECVIAERLEDRATKLVCSGACGHRHDAASGMSVLGGIVVGDNLELLHRIDRECRQLLRSRQPDSIGDVGAIEFECLVACAATRNG